MTLRLRQNGSLITAKSYVRKNSGEKFGRSKIYCYLCTRFQREGRLKLHFDFPHAQPNGQARWHSLNWKVGRVIDRAGLEIRYTPFGYRGFESLTFRQKANNGEFSETLHCFL